MKMISVSLLYGGLVLMGVALWIYSGDPTPLLFMVGLGMLMQSFIVFLRSLP